MAELLDYLKQAVETQASDLFIVAGRSASSGTDTYARSAGKRCFRRRQSG